MMMSLDRSLESNPMAPFVTENSSSPEIIFPDSSTVKIHQGFNN